MTQIRLLIRADLWLTVQWLSATIAESRRWILLRSAARRTTRRNFQISPAGRAEIRAHAVRGAAGATAARQWRNITPRFARDVIFDYLPSVFRKFVLPVSAECRQRE